MRAALQFALSTPFATMLLLTFTVPKLRTLEPLLPVLWLTVTLFRVTVSVLLLRMPPPPPTALEAVLLVIVTLVSVAWWSL